MGFLSSGGYFVNCFPLLCMFDTCRVIEQSIAEDSKLGMKRKRGELWFIDPLNPHERKRESDWPVGLKNVGNTCWFSAVIQVTDVKK